MADALPISFSRPLIPRVIDGSKTQTRRIAKFEALEPGFNAAFSGVSAGHYNTGNPASGHVLYSRGAGGVWNQRTKPLHCPYGQIGSKLWVREDHRIVARDGDRVRVRYEADGAERFAILNEHEVALLNARSSGWEKPQPGRFLYRSCSRISLELTQVRVERLQDISEEDARAEGCEPASTGRRVYPGTGGAFEQSYRAGFERLWDEINGDRASWEANPFVWVIAFRVAEVRR